MNADGSAKKQLTSDKSLKLTPCVAGDGKSIYYNITGNQLGGSARVEIDGKNPRMLDKKWTIDCAAKAPYIFYFSENGPITADLIYSLYRATTDLDAPVKVSDKPVQFYTSAPDGNRVAYIYW